MQLAQYVDHIEALLRQVKDGASIDASAIPASLATHQAAAADPPLSVKSKEDNASIGDDEDPVEVMSLLQARLKEYTEMQARYQKSNMPDAASTLQQYIEYITSKLRQHTEGPYVKMSDIPAALPEQ